MQSLSQLFTTIISKRGIHNQLNETSTTIRQLRISHKKNKVSSERMRQICTKAGYTFIQEELWSKI